MTFIIPAAETIVISGLITDNNGFEVRGGVPGLGEIPILSRLFTTRTEQQQSQSLLFFLAPIILEPTDDV
jgi:general secretion pathway protein D